MSDSQINYRSLVQISIITIVSAIVLYIVIKKLLNFINSENEGGTDNVKKRLFDYFTSEPSYDSLEKNNKPNNNEKPKNNNTNTPNVPENNDNVKKILRFAIDYCRASPNINFKNKTISNIGWRGSKYNIFVEFEMYNKEGQKLIKESILTINHTNRSFLNFEDDLNRNTMRNIFMSLDHPNILPFLHIDILPTHNFFLKVQEVNEMGSMKDLIYKCCPSDSFNSKYPFNYKGNPLNLSLISLYGRQILNGLNYLHKHNWYHLHLHCGNILITEERAYLTDLENFILSHSFRNEHCFNYVFDNFVNNSLNKNDPDSTILSEIFKSNFNIFDKIDIICFGRVLYEMAVGRELRAPFPDESEYKDMEQEVVEVLSMIFKKKTYKTNNISHSLSNMCELPTIGLNDLLNHKLFSYNIINTFSNNDSSGELKNYSLFLKNNIFDQNRFIKSKIKALNTIIK